jgi:Tfp pilus assembly protein PilN
VLGLLAGLALLAFLYGLAHHQVSSRHAKVASLTEKTQRVQAVSASLAPYKSFAALREQRRQAVSDLVDARFDWAHAFHELGRVLPQDASITSLDGSVGSSVSGSSSTGSSASSSGKAGSGVAGGPVASATPPGSVPTFTLSGCATSQQEVALTLSRLKLIDGVSEVTLQSSTKAGATAAKGAASTGSCPSGRPGFTVQVIFAPLPSSATIESQTVRKTAEEGTGR